MAREHLYKAKRKDNGEWAYGDFVCSWHKKQTRPTPMIHNNMGKFEVFPKTICECTNLIDKNGTKIFDGDVINIYVSDWWCGHKDVKIYEENALITYNDYAWAIRHGKFTTPVYDYIHPHDTDKQYYFEVIGNKFDTPELLEVQDEQAN